MAIDGYVPRENEEIVINYTTVGAEYFETMGIPIRQGREYNETDTPKSPRTLVINEVDGAPLLAATETRSARPSASDQNATEVVGIVADTKYNSINERPLPQLFIPMARAR